MKKVVVALKIVAILTALFFAYTAYADLWDVAGHYLQYELSWSAATLASAMIKATLAVVFAILSK